MEKLVIIMEALQKLGFDIDSLTFNEAVALKIDILEVVKKSGIKTV